MPIQLKCPNGHRLAAKESNAGKTGKCPVCKAAVSIPVLHQTVITDSAVVNILGDPGNTKKDRVGVTVTPVRKKTVGSSLGQSGSLSSSSVLPHVRLCPNCEQEIDMGYHICPHCHTYITGLNDF
ncbi:MAG: formate dehydrogenase accessory protein FdhE [Planctomycetaceae bacterium]|jgi:RNA polymerase subunit RPABC4/transcription elongation factor Spt4|nr:formate dehydrogenase accessory protein FdhE [Planctomycetaceae bacterium]